MVFSPGQVRQKGCHFRGVDIIERAVDVPRICAGALEQCLNYLVAKDVAVHLDLQEMALMLPAFVGRPDPARKCGPHTGSESKVGRVDCDAQVKIVRPELCLPAAFRDMNLEYTVPPTGPVVPQGATIQAEDGPASAPGA